MQNPPASLTLVLVVEEDQDVGFIIEALLRHFGFDIARATTAAEAILLATHRCPDVVVTELELTGTTAPQLCDSIRQNAERAIAFIGFTSDPDDFEPRIADGLDAVVRKPNFQNLVQTVRTVTRTTLTGGADSASTAA